MRSVYRTALFSLILCVSSACVAQSTPAAPSHPIAKRSEGVIDYALGKINPANKNYGDSTADARNEVVGATIQSLYFWSNVVSLTLLVAAATALVLVLRTQDKREIIAANLISQLWNGRIIDRKEILRRTEMYNALVEAKNSSLTPLSPVIEEEHRDVPVSDATIRTQPGQKSRVQSKTAAPKSPSSTGETGTLLPGELAEKAIFLEGQNQALRNSERNLRDRLNQVSLDLEQERRRNQTLKGA